MKAISFFTAAVFSVLSFVIVSCTSKNDPNDGWVRVVKTISATEIASSSALLTGQTGLIDASSGIVVGFIYSTNPNPAVGNGTEVVSNDIREDGSFTVRIKDLDEETTYYFVAFERSYSYRFGEAMSFTTTPFQIEAVDLGLSVKWGNANLGAKGQKAFGDYFAWGETETKDKYVLQNYKFYNEPSWPYPYWITKYNDRDGYGVVDNKSQLELEDDVAHVKLGGKWRIPTEAEWQELIDKCKWSIVWDYDEHFVTTVVCTATGPSGNTIYLPEAGIMKESHSESKGYYWSSNLDTPSESAKIAIVMHGGSGSWMSTQNRWDGLSVRAVCDY